MDKLGLQKVFLIALIAIWSTSFSFSQTQEITVNVSPNIGKSIKGHLELDRTKYFNLAANVNELNNHLDGDRFNRYFNEYEMNIGRALGMVYSETKWGSSLREDANRSGFVDTAYMASKLNPSDGGLDEYLNVFGSRQGLALHDRSGKHSDNTYPDFMPMFTLDNGSHYLPSNSAAHAEMAAHLMKNKYTDFQRPTFFELVNEPSYHYWGDQRFIDFHTATKEKFVEMNIPTEVGGPCFSVGYFYKQNFQNINSIQSFIDRTNFSMDFYSYHIYDYMKWDTDEGDHTGSVSSGLPTEGVFDALAAYTYNNYGKELSFVCSEHGGYNGDGTNRESAADSLADIHFPRSGFASDFLWEMEKRSIDNFLMVNSAITNTLTYMNHPHIVKKTVPFILLETSAWDTRYYSSLLVKENFDKNSNVWHESKLIHFFNYFDDVKGRRVKSICNDNDIQHFSFVNGDTLIMLFHNQSNVEGNIDINVDDIGIDIADMMIRRVGKGIDHRPYFTEEALSSLVDIEIGRQESLVIFAEYENEIPNNQTIDMIPYYSTNSAAEFSAIKSFNVEVPYHDQVEHAILRVGIGRQTTAASAKGMSITLNGTQLDLAEENSAERLTTYSNNSNNNSYATTKVIAIDPSLLLENNTVRVQFTDGGTGGVGAVVIRAGYSDLNSVEPIQEDPKNSETFLFPNPASESINIESKASGTFEVFALNGKLLLSENVSEGKNQFSVSSLERGCYIARMRNKNETLSQLMEIER